MPPITLNSNRWFSWCSWLSRVVHNLNMIPTRSRVRISVRISLLRLSMLLAFLVLFWSFFWLRKETCATSCSTFSILLLYRTPLTWREDPELADLLVGYLVRWESLLVLYWRNKLPWAISKSRARRALNLLRASTKGLLLFKSWTISYPFYFLELPICLPSWFAHLSGKQQFLIENLLRITDFQSQVPGRSRGAKDSRTQVHGNFNFSLG